MPNSYEEFDRCMTEIEQMKKKVIFVTLVCSNLSRWNWKVGPGLERAHGGTARQNARTWAYLY